eukprot:scaffold3922_cov64-Isochrysis_galbana.AAC.1
MSRATPLPWRATSLPSTRPTPTARPLRSANPTFPRTEHRHPGTRCEQLMRDEGLPHRSPKLGPVLLISHQSTAVHRSLREWASPEAAYDWQGTVSAACPPAVSAACPPAVSAALTPAIFAARRASGLPDCMGEWGRLIPGWGAVLAVDGSSRQSEKSPRRASKCRIRGWCASEVTGRAGEGRGEEEGRGRWVKGLKVESEGAPGPSESDIAPPVGEESPSTPPLAATSPPFRPLDPSSTCPPAPAHPAPISSAKKVSTSSGHGSASCAPYSRVDNVAAACAHNRHTSVFRPRHWAPTKPPMKPSAAPIASPATRHQHRGRTTVRSGSPEPPGGEATRETGNPAAPGGLPTRHTLSTPVPPEPSRPCDAGGPSMPSVLPKVELPAARTNTGEGTAARELKLEEL